MDAWNEVKTLPISTLFEWVNSINTSQRVSASLEINRRQFVCKECKLQFQYKSHYDRHLNSNKHKPKQIWICEFCKMEFKWKSHYVNHTQRKTSCG